MTLLVDFVNRMMQLASLALFMAYVNSLPDFVDLKKRGRDGKPKKQYIDKDFAKDCLVIVAAAGPMPNYELAGHLGVTAGSYKFFYTVKELRRIGAFKTYAKRGKISFLCVDGFTEPYVELSPDDRRYAVWKATSFFEKEKDVPIDYIQGPPLPRTGQKAIVSI